MKAITLSLFTLVLWTIEAAPASCESSVPPIGPVSATVLPRFAGFPTFARLPRIDEVHRYDVAILGVPWDSGTTYRPGARFGPSSIRQGSRLLRPYNPALDVMPFNAQQVVDAGDIGSNPFKISEALGQIEDGVRQVLVPPSVLQTQSDCTSIPRVIILGGDHTLSLPVLRVMKQRFGPVALLHFDAHLDTWDTYFGEPYTHGTPFRRAREEGLFLDDSSVHVGIRGPVYSSDDYKQDRDLGFRIISCSDIDRLGVKGVAHQIKERVGNRPVYISIDIDVLDPAFSPGTGTPEAGGFTSRELLSILRELVGVQIVSADVVEVAPAYDHAEITSIAAATVVYEILGLMAKTPLTVAANAISSTTM